MSSSDKSVWIVDAEDFSGNMDVLYDDQQNIKDYLSKNLYLGISATKGVGKTYLLQAKRRRINDQTNKSGEHIYLCLPPTANFESDWGAEGSSNSLENSSDFMKSKLRKDFETFVELWRYSILIYVIYCVNKEYFVKPDGDIIRSRLTKDFLIDKKAVFKNMQIKDIFEFVLCNICDRKEHDLWQSDISYIGSFLFSHPFFDSGRRVAVFIDKIDQAIDLDIYNETERFQEYNDVYFWHCFQVGLAVAAVRLKRENFFVFFSMRSEAYNTASTLLGQNYKKILNRVFTLYYTKIEQSEMFEKYIRAEADAYLVYPNDKDAPTYAFVGVETLHHPYAGVTENVFGCLFRHTFDRPRDTQFISQVISTRIAELRKLSTQEAREALLKDIIKDCSVNSIKDFLSEKSNFLPINWRTEDDWSSFFRKITTNIFNDQYVAAVCQNINKNDSCSGNCSSGLCSEHPFSILYQLGLLGVIVEEPTCYRQRFLNINSSNIIYNKHFLPSGSGKTIYLLHPALTKYIDNLKGSIMDHSDQLIISRGSSISKTDFEQLYESVRANTNLVALKKHITRNDMPISPRKKPSRCDIVILQATEDEEDAILRYSTEFEKKYYNDDYYYHEKKIRDVTIGIARTSRYGVQSTAIKGQDLVRELSPKIVAMTGFCAGREGKVQLGDLIIASKMYNYETGKQIGKDEILPDIQAFDISPKKQDRLKELARGWIIPSTVLPPTDINQQCNQFYFEFKNTNEVEAIDICQKFQNWTGVLEYLKRKKHIKYVRDSKIQLTELGEKALNKLCIEYPKGLVCKAPTVKLGVLATGTRVQEWTGIFDSLERKGNRKTVVLDMEGHSIGELGEYNDIPALVVKGVGDFARAGKALANKDAVDYCSFASYAFIEDNAEVILDILCD